MAKEKQREFKVFDYGAKPDGKILCTNSIQNAIDRAATAGGGVVAFSKGIYLTGAIFLKSNVEMVIDEGVEIRGVVDETAYPTIWSRVAGIEMDWPSGLINVCGQNNVKITGAGLINGQGEYWWDKYWGEDKLGGMRKDYTARGLRWAVDYDCERPRNIIVLNSSEVTLEKFNSIRSPFWNIHICYSDKVHVDGLKIRENKGPSTDGIDIDSSSNVLVENCYIECNDDNLCIKSGRDADGLRVNRVAENIVIRGCETGLGGGITIGSETSGGVRNVEIYNIKAKGTENGLRFKSARTRGGVIENIHVHDVEMIDVPNPFSFQLNWNPSYSYAVIPEDWDREIPAHWKVLAKTVEPPEMGIPEFRNININNIEVKSFSKISVEKENKRQQFSKAFDVDAYPQKPISQVHFKDVTIEADEAGSILNAKDWTMENVILRTVNQGSILTKNCENVQLPRME
ncbi:MAG: endopolygalacturonase [Firmicutes bacterium]|nr:endopolygalacturonase [Bacillota bacterium]